MKTNLHFVDNLCDIRLEAEELEAVIAPGLTRNHNESFLAIGTALEVEELEAIIAPGIGRGLPNHNETFLATGGGLQAEELEPVIAPGLSRNHNETFLTIQ